MQEIDYHTIGWDLPKNRGGALIRGDHCDYVYEVHEMFSDRKQEKLRKLNVNDTDLKAFDAWDEENMVLHFENFCVEYLNFGKIGSNADTRWRGIVTTDPKPYTRFQDYIREGGCRIAAPRGGFQGMSFFERKRFNEQTGLFEVCPPEYMDIQEDREKRAQLEEELKRNVGIDLATEYGY